MLNHAQQPALLANIAGAHLPPVALNISSQYQFCVDAGASAAVGFFDDLTAVGLHDHIALSMCAFSSSVGVGMAAAGAYAPAKMQACTDAFAAGYLGRSVCRFANPAQFSHPHSILMGSSQPAKEGNRHA